MVWTVLYTEKWEGATLEGVFSTREKARDYKKRMDNEDPCFRSFKRIIIREIVDGLCKEVRK